MLSICCDRWCACASAAGSRAATSPFCTSPPAGPHIRQTAAITPASVVGPRRFDFRRIHNACIGARTVHANTKPKLGGLRLERAEAPASQRLDPEAHHEVAAPLVMVVTPRRFCDQQDSFDSVQIGRSLP